MEFINPDRGHQRERSPSTERLLEGGTGGLFYQEEVRRGQHHATVGVQAPICWQSVLRSEGTPFLHHQGPQFRCLRPCIRTVGVSLGPLAFPLSREQMDPWVGLAAAPLWVLNLQSGDSGDPQGLLWFINSPAQEQGEAHRGYTLY